MWWLWAGASDELGIPQDFSEVRELGGVGYLSSLVHCWPQGGSPR